MLNDLSQGVAEVHLSIEHSHIQLCCGPYRGKQQPYFAMSFQINEPVTFLNDPHKYLKILPISCFFDLAEVCSE